MTTMITGSAAIPLTGGCPAWATEVSIADAGLPTEMVSYEGTLYDGLILPDPVVMGMVEVRLIALQHSRDDCVPAALPYLEVATFPVDDDAVPVDGAGRTHLVLPAEACHGAGRGTPGRRQRPRSEAIVIGL